MYCTRRSFLRTGAALVPIVGAGCVADPAGDEAGAGVRAQASFYLLYDFARNVAGDAVEVESVVPFGQHGHGWDGPTAGQQRDILTADLFIYMGEGFQPWADDVIDAIHDDDAEVEVVRARAGVDLLAVDAVPEDDQDQDHDQNHNGDAGDHGEDDEHEHGDEHDDAEDHDHGDAGHDPHFWLDPRRTARAVENVRDGLIAVDPDTEAAYRERAETYVDELDELDASFDAALSNPSRDAVFVAGHNAFRYLGDAYGFDVFGLTGISPDEGLSASARRDAEAIIREHDIEHVLHPVLEPRTPAEQLVADTPAREILDVTAISGVTDEWVEADWGYVDLMERINLPAFERALGGE